jgi:hypothetical protein
MSSPYSQMPQQQASLPASKASMIDQQQQLDKMNSLKAFAGGDSGIVAVPLQSSIKGPAGSQLSSTNDDLQSQFAKQSSLGSHDTPPVLTKMKGGKTQGKGKRKWSLKYKKSINCRRPKGFSKRQHCKYGRKKMRQTIRRRKASR